MKRNNVVLMCIVIFMLLLAFSTGASAASISDFSDMPSKDSWSYEALASAVDNGLLNGNDGRLNPTQNMTRAELAAITVRAFGAYEKADISGYTDVSQDAWYYESIQEAVAMGILNGYPGMTMHPNAYVTRQEAFAVIARVLLLADGTADDLAGFTDQDDVSSWALGTTAAMVSNGYVAGNGGSLYPKSNISRQEFAQIFYNCFQHYYSSAGTYSSNLDGNAIINEGGVTLSNVTIDGDLFIAEGSGASGMSTLAESPDQDITLDNVKITGRLVIRESDGASIYMKNNSSAQGIIYVDGAEEDVFAYVTNSGLVLQMNAEGTYSVIDYYGNDTTVTIPETYHDIDVTAVTADAFAGNTTVDTIVFPSTLTSIADGACSGCSALANLQFEGNIADVSMTEDAFTGTAWATAEQDYSATYEQQKDQINFAAITITVDDGDDNPAVLTGVDGAVVHSECYLHDSETVSLESADNAVIDADTASGAADVCGYGYIMVSSMLTNGNNLVAIFADPVKVGVGADEYNIAALYSSLPTAYFTLSLWDIPYNDEDEPIPTFVTLERYRAYDWSQLPENVYGVPTADPTESILTKINCMKEFVADLLEITPDAQFHMYMSDIYCEVLPKILYTNGIDDSQYDGVILSDGAASYGIFNNIFSNSETAQAKFDEMQTEWETFAADTRTSGTYDISGLKYKANYPDGFANLQNYAYVLAAKDNIDYWVARSSNFSISDATFLTTFKTYVTDKSLNTMLNELTSKGPDVEAAFKAIYHFSDDMFSEAQEQDKKVMMFLGTRVTNETNFETFAKFIMAYYGDDYVYYYKGHPATPTDLYPDKQSELADLGIIDVDSSINAELILYFYPDIYMCGYPSSTFDSVDSPEMACALFNVTKAAGSGMYGGIVQMFLTAVDSTNATYGSLCPAGDTCALVEFKDTTEHDIAIWDANTETITYYKNTGTAEAPVWTDVTPK